MTPLTGPILTGDAMRAAERAAGCSLSELMDRAGASLAESAWRFGGGQPILIACGPGNNGGDGYVAARLLKQRGADVRVAALREPRAELAMAARARWDGPVEALETAVCAPVLVDALFGTGLKRPLEPEVQVALARLSDQASFLIAVDLPSGVGTDDGTAFGAVQADLTLALGALKPAHLIQPAAGLCGHVHVANIGIPTERMIHVLTRPRLPVPGPDSHKYKRGFAGIAGGAMGGAAMLAARAAMPLAGYVALAGARRTGPDALVHRRLETLIEDPRLGALLAGPGLGRNDAARGILDQVLRSGRRLVLDADALMLMDETRLSRLANSPSPPILTPHDGEFATLFGPVEGPRWQRAQTAATTSGCIVVLKGANTIIAAPGGAVAIAPAAPGWLASAGTGDVLGGIIVALYASGDLPFVDPFSVACAAVWLHGEAARLAGPALTADDLPRHIPAAASACL